MQNAEVRRKKFYLVLPAIALLCVWIFWKKEAQPLSFSDNGIYPAHCAKLAREGKLFSNFKQDSFFTLFHENVTPDEGKTFLDQIAPDLLARCDWRCNDQIGNPKLSFYKPHGNFSPSTLFYLKIASDLREKFGSLDGCRVVEIGAGYGGMCTVLSSLFSLKSYTLVDLPDVLELSKRYLHEQKIDALFSSYDALPQAPVDLVISTLSFSELDRSLQTEIIQKIFSHAERGFLICVPGHWKEIPISAHETKRVKPLDQKRILKALRDQGIEAAILSEDPSTGKDHFILYWDHAISRQK